MEHFPVVKFAMGYEKNMSFLLVPKLPKVWKKAEKIELGSCKINMFISEAHLELTSYQWFAK